MTRGVASIFRPSRENRRRAVAAAGTTAALVLGAGGAPAQAVVPSDPGFAKQYALHNTGQIVGTTAGRVDADIDAPEAWDLSTGSPAVKVAVVDDGVDFALTDLAPNLVPGYDFGNQDADPAQAESDHGSQTSSLLGARGNNAAGMAGVAWSVSLMPVKVRTDGPGERFDLIAPSAVAAAFRYAGAQGARVANASFGLRSTTTATERADVLAALKASPNTLFVVSAGNSARDNDASPRYPCNFALPNLLCVAATDKNDALWSSSNYGARSVHLAAPGVQLYAATRRTSGYVDGTSYAAPLVSGTAALYLARHPSASVADVRHAILSSVDLKPTLTGKTVTGGRLNAARALAIPPGGPPPADTTAPPAPAVTPASGSYAPGTQVAMSDAEAGVTIRYTTGAGTTVPADPTSATGAAYTGPITIGASQVIRAAAFDAAGNRSTVVERRYTVSAGTPSAATIAADSFGRVASGGLGPAETGGTWTVVAGGAGSFSVDGARAQIASPNGAGERQAVLASTSARDLDARMDVTFPDPAGTSGSFYAYLTLRRQADGSHTRVGLIAQGRSLLIRGQTSAGTTLWTNVNTNLGFVPGTPYSVRVQATGVSPTTLRARAWKAGTAEPGAWGVTTTTSTGPQTAGSIGLRTANDTAISTTVAVDDLRVIPLSAG